MHNGVTEHPSVPQGTSLMTGTPRPAALAARLGRAAGTSPALPAGIQVVQNWPDRIAAVITSTPSPRALATLERFGFTPRVVSPTAAHDTPQRVGPCTFVLIGADALGVDSGELVGGFRRISPYAPVLLFDRQDNAKSTLVAAMRAGVTEVVDPGDDVRFAEVITQQLQIAGKHRERVLAIGAHPDDIEIGCAGALFNHRRRGDRISLLTLGTGDDQSARADSPESALAARLIGAQLLAADLKESCLSDLVLTSRIIDGVVAALDPTVVYIHSRNDGDHDHRAVHEAGLRAVRAVPQVYAYQSPSSTPSFNPTKLVPIDDVVSAKADLLRIVRGNTGRSAMQPDLVVEGARHWARQLPARTRYAEPFEIIRSSGQVR